MHNFRSSALGRCYKTLFYKNIKNELSCGLATGNYKLENMVTR